MEGQIYNFLSKFIKFAIQHLFWIATAVYTFGNTIFVIFGTSVEQKWNRVQNRVG